MFRVLRLICASNNKPMKKMQQQRHQQHQQKKDENSATRVCEHTLMFMQSGKQTSD